MSILDVTSPFDKETEEMILKSILFEDAEKYKWMWDQLKKVLKNYSGSVEIGTILKAMNILEGKNE